MYILLLSSIAYYPAEFTYDSWYVILVSCFTTLVASFGLLGCMFGPKVYILLFRPEQNTLKNLRSLVSSFSFEKAQRMRALPLAINTDVT